MLVYAPLLYSIPLILIDTSGVKLLFIALVFLTDLVFVVFNLGAGL